jgi:hypothetical protein
MLRRWATASRKERLEAMVAVGCLELWLEALDVKVRKEVNDVIASEFEEGMAVLAREEALSGIYGRRPLRRVGSSSGAVIAMARTRRARRNAVLERIILLPKHNRMA